MTNRFLCPTRCPMAPNTEPMFPLPGSTTWANDFRTRGARACWQTARMDDMRKRRRKRSLNPYRPATDTGLLKIFALVAAIILIVISGALDCRFAFLPLGFC